MNHASQRRMAKSEAESERKTVNFHIAENEIENEAHQAFIHNEESKESSKNTRNPFRIFRRRKRIQTGKNRALRQVCLFCVLKSPILLFFNLFFSHFSPFI